MSHYYQNDPNLKVDLREITYDFRGEKLKLISDSGVFSKNRIDFGTNLLLNSLPNLDDQLVLDVGCGYGIIGIAIAKKYKNAQVELIDVNTKAIDLTKENILLNKLTNAIAYPSNVYENVNKMYDAIVTNPPIRAGKEVVHKIVLGSRNYLNAKGAIYLVIRKQQGALSLLKEMEKIFAKVEILEKKNGYFIFKGLKES